MKNRTLAAGLASLAIAGCDDDKIKRAPSTLRTPETALVMNADTRETLLRVIDNCAERALEIMKDTDQAYLSGIRGVMTDESGENRGHSRGHFGELGGVQFDRGAVDSLTNSFLTNCVQSALPNGGIGACEMTPTEVYYEISDGIFRVVHQIYSSFTDATDPDWVAKMGPDARTLRLPPGEIPTEDVRCAVDKNSPIWNKNE